MPHCLAALEVIYERLGVRFDVHLGESFYDPMLPGVVESLEAKGLAPAPPASLKHPRDRPPGSLAESPAVAPIVWRHPLGKPRKVPERHELGGDVAADVSVGYRLGGEHDADRLSA